MPRNLVNIYKIPGMKYLGMHWALHKETADIFGIKFSWLLLFVSRRCHWESITNQPNWGAAGWSSWSRVQQPGESLTEFAWQHVLHHCWLQTVQLEIQLPCISIWHHPKASGGVNVEAVALLSIWNPIQCSVNDVFCAFSLGWDTFESL